MSAGRTYAINHVHVRATDPLASAAWYEEHFTPGSCRTGR